MKYKEYETGMFTVKKVDYGYTSTLLVALKPFTLHWIDIAAANAGGEGPVSNCIKKTLEGGLKIFYFFVFALGTLITISWVFWLHFNALPSPA